MHWAGAARRLPVDCFASRDRFRQEELDLVRKCKCVVRFPACSRSNHRTFHFTQPGQTDELRANRCRSDEFRRNGDRAGGIDPSETDVPPPERNFDLCDRPHLVSRGWGTDHHGLGVCPAFAGWPGDDVENASLALNFRKHGRKPRFDRRRRITGISRSTV